MTPDEVPTLAGLIARVYRLKEASRRVGLHPDDPPTVDAETAAGRALIAYVEAACPALTLVRTRTP